MHFLASLKWCVAPHLENDSNILNMSHLTQLSLEVFHTEQRVVI